MVSVFDVAKYILEQHGKMSKWKLNALCYFSQAYHFAWTSERLIVEEFHAFDDGLIGWQKLPIRSQESLYEWEFDDCDNLTALEHSARKKIPRECARNFSAGSDLFELVAVSKRKIFSEVREVVQVLVVGDKFLGGVACLNQDIHVAEDVGDF